MSTERAGVYAIVHTPTGRRYIGSAANLSKRWSRHRQELRDGLHRNTHLQNTWTRDGAAAFTWHILAIVEPDERIALEQRVMDAWQTTDPDRGFNRAAIAGVSYGGGARERTPEWRDTQSVAWRERRPPRVKVGDTCATGRHVIDGSYVRRRKGRTGRVTETLRCQGCEREGAMLRERKKRGIPPDHPRGAHHNRRTRDRG